MNTKTAREKEKWMRGKSFILVLSFLFVFSSLGIAIECVKREKPKSFVFANQCKRLEELTPVVKPRNRNIPSKWQFAVAIKSDLKPKKEEWETLHDGSHLWRLRIFSKGALSLNLGITTFKLPAGGKLWIYDPQKKSDYLQGPYTNKDGSKGELWTPLVPGEEIVVELNIPRGGINRTNIKITSVNHEYHKGNHYCRKNVACLNDSQCQKQIRSAAWFHVEGIHVGSGVLLNNTGRLQHYFLTAFHTGLNRKNAHTMVIYWNYESKKCNDRSGGKYCHNQLGAKLCAAWKSSDFVLVKLEEPPDPKFNVYYSGWDANWNLSEVPPKILVGIHHPRVKEKAYCLDKDPVKSTDRRGNTRPLAYFWQIKEWDTGTTEPGSSGSGLWAAIGESDELKVVGQLLGGDSDCLGNNEIKLPDRYGKLSVSWDGGGTPETRLRDWLDPAGRGRDKKLKGTNPR